MSLLDPSSITARDPERVMPTSRIQCSDKSTLINGIAADLIAASSSAIADGHTLHLTSYGTFSMHELLRALLDFTGPSEVCICTWAMTENPVRAIADMKSQGLITGLHLLFDYKIKQRSGSAIALAEQIADSHSLTKCHAKVTTITNPELGISIVGSANYTRNPRIERLSICADRSVAAFDRDWIKAEIQKQ